MFFVKLINANGPMEVRKNLKKYFTLDINARVIS